MRKIITISALSFLIITPIFCGEFSASAEEETTEKTLEKRSDYKQYRVKGQVQTPQPKDRFKVKFYLGAAEGYDNNVFLDSSRKGDLYDEAVAACELSYELSERLILKAESDSSSMTYHRFSDYSLMDNDIALSLAYYPCQKMKVETGYDIDFVNYLRNENGTYYAQGPFASFRYSITPSTYLGTGYLYRLYDYDKRKIYDGTYRRLELTREDHRHEIMAEFAAIIGKVYFKLKNVYYFNESNDGYMDYYDYQAEKVMGYIGAPLFKKAELVLSGGYQRKNFKSRKITTSSSKEHDDLMVLGGGLYYNLTPSSYINLSYTYRQNFSNDPIQEYSGSMSSIGLHYFF